MPNQDDCPECSNQYKGYRQSRTNRRFVHERLDHPQDMDWRIKNEGVHNRLGKRGYDQNWAGRDKGEKSMISKRDNVVLEV